MGKRIYNEIDEMFEKLELINSILVSSDVTILENVDKVLNSQTYLLKILKNEVIKYFLR